MSRQDGAPGEHGAGHPDQKHVDQDAEPDPERILRARPRRRNRQHDVVHHSVHQEAVDRAGEHRLSLEERPTESDQVIHHRGDNRDQEMQSQPQCRGTPTSVKARLTQQAGGDILEDALRRYLALHRPERVGIEDVKRAGDKSAGQDVCQGMGPLVDEVIRCSTRAARMEDSLISFSQGFNVILSCSIAH